MGNHLMVGGQAVIEGVMMRGPKLTATAVRDPNGEIQVETKDVNSISDRYPILKKPMLRGTVSLIESLVIGIRSLSYSAKMAGEEDEQLSDKEMAGYEQQGRQAIINDIPQTGIMEMAKESAARVMVPFFVGMGFNEKDITISFRKDFSDNEIKKMIVTASDAERK